jgi:hypothetical protein
MFFSTHSSHPFAFSDFSRFSRRLETKKPVDNKIAAILAKLTKTETKIEESKKDAEQEILDSIGNNEYEDLF